MKRWKLVVAIATPAALVAGLLAWIAIRAVSGLGQADEARAALGAFLTLVRDGRFEDAHREAAPELRCRMSLAQFRVYAAAKRVGELRLGARMNASIRREWPLVSVADIDVSDGQSAPQHAALLKLGETWRFAWIEPMPVVIEQKMDKRCGERSMHFAMIREPLRDLLAGLERGDFSGLARRFHPSRAATAQTLAAQYAAVAPRAAALKEAVLVEPVFVPDPKYTDGDWRLDGFVAARAARFAFRAELKLDGGWKLMRFDIDAGSN